MKKFPANQRVRESMLNNNSLQSVRVANGLPKLKERVRKCMKCEEKFLTIYPAHYVCCKSDGNGYEEHENLSGVEDTIDELNLNV